MSDDAVWLCRV